MTDQDKLQPRCSVCGKFMAYRDLGKHCYKYTPDTHFSTEEHEYWHKECDDENSR